ncbi:MAG: hypothetical protein WAQ27_00360 [Candidatus Microsaccharimonas sp.]
MGTRRQAGFTIVETVLFLGISSLLVVTFIVGTGATINNQRYRDAVETFKSMLQEQYTDLSSVENARSNNWSCASNASISDQGATLNDQRGQSDCVLVGKYVRVDNDKISIYQVLGVGAAGTTVLNDIQDLKNNYTLNVSTTEVDSKDMEWGTQIAWPATVNGAPNPQPKTPRKLGIFVVRSPDSGRIYTFTASDDDVPDVAALGPVAFANMLITGNTVPGQGAQLICVASNGLSNSSDRAVYLNSYAATTSAVELRTNDYIKTLTPAGTETTC